MNACKTCLLTMMFLLLDTGRVVAVECPRRASVADALGATTAVFSGKAVAEEFRKVRVKTDADTVETNVLVVKFKVERWWKGGDSKEVVLHTMSSKQLDGTVAINSNDFHFRKGERYLVYAYGSPDKLRTSACARTGRLIEAEDDLRLLGEGSPASK